MNLIKKLINIKNKITNNPGRWIEYEEVDENNYKNYF